MPILTFLIYTVIATTLWVSFLTYGGYILGDRYTEIKHFLAPISKIILGLILGVIIVWLLRKYLRNNR